MSLYDTCEEVELLHCVGAEMNAAEFIQLIGMTWCCCFMTFVVIVSCVFLLLCLIYWLVSFNFIMTFGTDMNFYNRVLYHIPLECHQKSPYTL